MNFNIVKADNQLYTKKTYTNYRPTAEELYFYYGGTHAGINQENPYSKRYGMSIKKTVYELLPPNKLRSK